MQDRPLEIVSKQQITTTTDMKHRTSQFLKLYIHQISHRIILHETAGLHLHSEGVHLCQILVIGSFDHILTNFSTVAKSLLRSDKTHLAIILTSHKDHTLGLDAADLTRSKVSKNTYLLAHHILRRILLCDS